MCVYAQYNLSTYLQTCVSTDFHWLIYWLCNWHLTSQPNPNSWPTPKTCSPCGFLCLNYRKSHSPSSSNPLPTSNKSRDHVSATHTFIHSHILSIHHMSCMILNIWVPEKKEMKILPFNFLNLIKGIYRKPKANITKCSKILKTSLLREENSKDVHLYRSCAAWKSCSFHLVQ